MQSDFVRGDYVLVDGSIYDPVEVARVLWELRLLQAENERLRDVLRATYASLGYLQEAL